MRNKVLALAGLLTALIGAAVIFLVTRPSARHEVKLPGNFFVSGESVPVPLPRTLKEMGPFTLSLDELKTPDLSAKRFSVRVVPESMNETALGIFREILVQCGELDYRGMHFRDVKVRFVKPQLNLPLLFKSGDVQLLSLERLEPDAEMRPDFLVGLVKQRTPWLESPALVFEGKRATLTGRLYGRVPIEADFNMNMEKETFTLSSARFSAAGITVPRALVRSFLDQTILLSRDTDMLYHLDIADVREQNGMIKIAASQ